MSTTRIDKWVANGLESVKKGDSVDTVRERMRAAGEKEEMVKYVASAILDEMFHSEESVSDKISGYLDKGMAFLFIGGGVAFAYVLYDWSDRISIYSTMPLIVIGSGIYMLFKK